ncbi:3-oxoacyl-ACP reductase FabG [Aliagarivorans taiwanensis]|uniref:3-oxoacyl-ACP reductase FabG n=1 Tax=Aliagarivorans taiwanensis TaxID=561966 RepID=UPI0004092F23|nr:3-oxoacyl-ACP reductase FabG [Aliagarivorans taiwanensis]
MHNKICIVTGGSRGIGEAIVTKFATQQAEAVFAVDMNIDGAKALEQRFTNVHPIQLNVTDAGAINDFIATVKQRYGRVDVLVNNAGITRDNLIQNMSEEEWDLVLDVNLKGVFFMTRAVAPLMMENDAGSIITIASIVGTDGNVGQSNYAATKGGVISMTKGWAKEFARKGAKVRANCVAPGFVETPMAKEVPEKILDAIVSKTPLKRLGQPEDIANGVAFLAGDESSFITGQTLKIDGGLVL